jgi:hypothetical protein
MNLLETYHQTYTYDTGNNLTHLSHQANSSTWQQTLAIRPNNNRSTETQLVVVIVQYLDVSAPRLRFISLQTIDSERLSKELMEQIDDPWSRSIIINAGLETYHQTYTYDTGNNLTHLSHQAHSST